MWRLGLVAAATLMAGALPVGPPNSLGLVPGVQEIRPVDPVRVALRETLDAAAGPLADYYRAQGFRPLWVADGRLRPEAFEVLRLVRGAADDALDPAAYAPAKLEAALNRARAGDAQALARAELAVSSAFSHYISDLHRPPAGAALQFRDPGLPAPPLNPRAVLDAAAGARDAADYVATMRRMHPIYERLRDEYRQVRASGGDDASMSALLAANMARARALPADPGPRYVIVDPAAQRLWAFENGRAVDTMQVIVGRTSAETPNLGARIQYASFQPYWNVPVDVTRDEIAPHVLREGTGYLRRERMEVLSDWSEAAHAVDPDTVDWAAVAAGTTLLRVRGVPGDWNILGRVKLMAPNPLGIYLHDTPDKGPFAHDARALSHGCIRLEHAMRLTRWLLGARADNPPSGPDARVDLAAPVPVYVIYMTLTPNGRGLDRWPDLYGRDKALLAELAEAKTAGGD